MTFKEKEKALCRQLVNVYQNYFRGLPSIQKEKLLSWHGLPQRCQTRVVTAATHDISRVFPPLLNRVWAWPECKASSRGPRATVLVFYLFSWSLLWNGTFTNSLIYYLIPLHLVTQVSSFSALYIIWGKKFQAYLK